MKVMVENPDVTDISPQKIDLRFPSGIVGFPSHQRGVLFHHPDQLPFQWLRLEGPDQVHFVVIDPTGLISDYMPELFDDDALAIGVTNAEEVLLLNIVTLRGESLADASVNLVGPIVINRHTGAARQVVIANHGRYSARHPLAAGN
jgi:flagellar assembly factor FliW